MALFLLSRGTFAFLAVPSFPAPRALSLRYSVHSAEVTVAMVGVPWLYACYMTL